MPERGDLGRLLRKEMADKPVLKDPFERVVDDFGKKGDPIVEGIFGEILIISDYGGYKRPKIGQKVMVGYTSYAGSFSYGKLIDVIQPTLGERLSDAYHSMLRLVGKG